MFSAVGPSSGGTAALAATFEPRRSERRTENSPDPRDLWLDGLLFSTCKRIGGLPPPRSPNHLPQCECRACLNEFS